MNHNHIIHQKGPNYSPQKATTSSGWTYKRSCHTASFAKLSKNITETLIEKGKVISLSDIHEMYKAIYKEEKLKSNSIDSTESIYQPHHLLTKIFQKFPELTKTVYKNRSFIHRSVFNFQGYL